MAVDGLFEVCETVTRSISRPQNNQIIDACLTSHMENGDNRLACVGRVTESCLSSPDNFSTAEHRACIANEHSVWDGKLNASYANLMSAIPDAENRNAVRTMQRNWIAFRDSVCALDYDRTSGNMFLVTGDDCAMTLTAQQAFRGDDLIEIVSKP